MDFLGLLILSFVGESIWETLKMTWRNGKVNIDRVGALIVGLLLAFGSSLDIMAVVGVPIIVPYLGTVLTGILISRGANFVHDIMSSISNLKQYTDISK